MLTLSIRCIPAFVPTDSKFTGKERDSESGLDYFGARYDSSQYGRFMSPDPSLKSAITSDPQTWNRYAYTRNNPLRFVDIGGKCTAPAGVGQGQVGVCIEAYIAAPRIGGLGFGDNRGTLANGGTFRYQFQAVIDTRAAGNPIVSEHDEAGRSQVGVRAGSVSLPLASSSGIENTNVSKPTQDNNGNIHFTVGANALNGFAGFPFAPTGTIQLSVPLVVSPQGTVGVDPGGSRSAYPSLEIYSYDSAGNPTSVLQMGETKPSDLGSLNQAIPAVPPPPPCSAEQRNHGDCH